MEVGKREGRMEGERETEGGIKVEAVLYMKPSIN